MNSERGKPPCGNSRGLASGKRQKKKMRRARPNEDARVARILVSESSIMAAYAHGYEGSRTARGPCNRLHLCRIRRQAVSAMTFPVIVQPCNGHFEATLVGAPDVRAE